MKSILVLEGGALRGIYTAGVLDVLLDEDIQVDAVVGVSAGALFGINYVSKQKGRCLKYNLDYLNDPNYMGFSSFIKTGNIMNEETCFHKMIYETHPFDFDTFLHSKIKFYAVVSNVETGSAEYVLIKDARKDMEYLRASGSMPLVSRFVRIDGKKYLDGGMTDSIPVSWALSEGYDKVIVVTTRPEEYRKKKSIVFPYYFRYFRYPLFLRSVRNRYLHYNETVDSIQKLEKDGKIFVVRPSRFVPIKRIEKNKDRVLEMYQLGVDDMKKELKKLKNYLKG